MCYNRDSRLAIPFVRFERNITIMFYNKEMETMPRKELEKLQLEKLKKLAVYCYENVKLYKDKFDAVKLDPYKIKTLSDIQYIPYTTKADFRDNYPFNMFAVPMKKIIRLHASSGTTGKPTVVGYTQNDVEMWSECMARLVAAAGATDEDIVQICFGYGLFTGALGLHYGYTQFLRQYRKAGYADEGLRNNSPCCNSLLCTENRRGY